VIPLSVLDLSPVTTATPGSAALHNSLDLARLADRLGYTDIGWPNTTIWRISRARRRTS
jgi:hypothetical protein